jgi:hypothetical protein
MAFLEIYRREADGSFTWVAGACSVKMARAIIKSAASTPTEEYLICDNEAGEKLTLRANGCWLASKESPKASVGGSALSFNLRQTRDFM